jgi:hypothetical protein
MHSPWWEGGRSGIELNLSLVGAIYNVIQLNGALLGSMRCYRHLGPREGETSIGGCYACRTVLAAQWAELSATPEQCQVHVNWNCVKSFHNKAGGQLNVASSPASWPH